MPKLSVSLTYILNAVIKNSTILTRGEQLKNMKNHQMSVSMFKHKALKSARPRAFVRFAKWLIQPWQLPNHADGIYHAVSSMQETLAAMHKQEIFQHCSVRRPSNILRSYSSITTPVKRKVSFTVA